MNVRARRTALGLTQDECAERCHGLDPAVLRTIEVGEANATQATLSRLCDGLECDMLDLYAHGPPLTKRRPGRPKKPPAAE